MMNMMMMMMIRTIKRQ